MIKLFFAISLTLSLTALASARPLELALEDQKMVVEGEDILSDGLPYIAVHTREAGLTYAGEKIRNTNQNFALGRAQERADNFCQAINYLQAKTVALDDLSNIETVSGWLVDSPDSVKLVSESRKVSQLSWLSMIAGKFAYRYPMIFNRIVCIR